MIKIKNLQKQRLPMMGQTSHILKSIAYVPFSRGAVHLSHQNVEIDDEWHVRVVHLL